MNSKEEAFASSTRERLMDAAQRLFGERGYAGVSLRAITDAAESNIAAVNYHFRSKDGLFRALVAQVMDPVNTERAQRLECLLADNGTPTVEQLVRAFIEPGLALRDFHGEHAVHVARFIAIVLLDPSPHVRQLFADQVHAVEGRYLHALYRALPDQDVESVRFGYVSMLGLLALHQAQIFTTLDLPTLAEQSSQHTTTDSDQERLITFIVKGLTSQ